MSSSNGSETGKELVKISGLKKHFPIRKGFFNRQVGAVRALDGIDLTIREGETLGLVGESGCGKSTLGRVVLRLLPATAGSVTFEGRNVLAASEKEMKAFRRDMQIVFQNPYASLDPRMTIRQIVQEPLEVHQTASGSDLRDRVLNLLDLVGLAKEMADRYPHEFSGGQRQRVGIARALALRPKLIVADEPVSALDVSVQAQILNLLIQLKSEFKLTYLFIAHNLDVVRYISDRIAVMYLGRIVELGECDEVYNQPLHPYSKALISAAPVPDPDFDRSNRMLLPGDLPSPANPPSGCRFHTRCPMARDKCKVDDPALREITPSHFSACHFAEELLTPPEQA
ncbi:dipeptide ABC transporter ATP-binding protein [Candidatus Obscuribacterales bacterium]|nr:dipeptide ABC transporter ATP-binding protein [Candidatus Obscuribacterales bacterium]MBX3151646.1 dipeptide ABC transporter ATP-binding protein [Candidatus Obscuribacterales bacterium]